MHALSKLGKLKLEQFCFDALVADNPEHIALFDNRVLRCVGVDTWTKHGRQQTRLSCQACARLCVLTAGNCMPVLGGGRGGVERQVKGEVVHLAFVLQPISTTHTPDTLADPSPLPGPDSTPCTSATPHCPPQQTWCWTPSGPCPPCATSASTPHLMQHWTNTPPAR